MYEDSDTVLQPKFVSWCLLLKSTEAIFTTSGLLFGPLLPVFTETHCVSLSTPFGVASSLKSLHGSFRGLLSKGLDPWHMQQEEVPEAFVFYCFCPYLYFR